MANLRQEMEREMRQVYRSRPSADCVGRDMQIVRGPCDINGPLAEGSLWPYEVLVFPSSARPDNAWPLQRAMETEITVANQWTTILWFDPGMDTEGRVIEWGVEEVNADGDALLGGHDLVYRFIHGKSPNRGAQIVDLDSLTGQWARILSPTVFPLKLERNKILALQVLAPTVVGSRYIRALGRGWTAAFIGGGTFASGAGRS